MVFIQVKINYFRLLYVPLPVQVPATLGHKGLISRCHACFGRQKRAFQILVDGVCLSQPLVKSFKMAEPATGRSTKYSELSTSSPDCRRKEIEGGPAYRACLKVCIWLHGGITVHKAIHWHCHDYNLPCCRILFCVAFSLLTRTLY